MPDTPHRLSPSEIEKRLETLPEWKEQDGALIKTYSFSSYLDGLAFVNRLGMDANRVDHHPRLVLDYKRVTVQYATHSAGGITELDCEGARAAEAMAVAAASART